MARSWIRFLGLAALLVATLGFSAGPVSATTTSPGEVMPNAWGAMDCNGHSPVYHSIKLFGSLCADPVTVTADGERYRFYDNGHYVGHDEPSVKFISTAPGSGSHMTYLMKLAVDPKAKPTVTSPKVSKFAELSPAPWFGLPICDPKSFPQNPCTPASDTNDPNVAGSAFMELQFYAPGFEPFIDGPSCDATRYCAALNIDSLSCDLTGFCNGNCIEPINFAYLQTDGVPAGPPSPQLINTESFFPNRHTLYMNQGDVLRVTLQDTPQGFKTTIDDLTTGKTGFMVASAANGFMNTNEHTCGGTPFTFHPEYSTARQQNQVPWAALEGGVLMQNELGHFEPCSSVTNSFPSSADFGGGHTFSDPKTFQTCVGGFEHAGATGEGPCNVNTGVCTNPTTEGNVACPSNNFTSGFNCEYSDASCMPAGARSITVDGKHETVRWPIAGCLTNVFQNGDLDFDGSSYKADWPDGTANHPSTFQFAGPFDGDHQTYPNIQFETDVAASENMCDLATGTGCIAQPVGAAFYPFWTVGSGPQLGSEGSNCNWNFGNVIAGHTTQSFGGPAQYGSPNLDRFPGTVISKVMPNPQLGENCGEGDNNIR
jgi:hypothetical protein